MGPCYCDCHESRCKILENSLVVANELGCMPTLTPGSETDDATSPPLSTLGEPYFFDRMTNDLLLSLNEQCVTLAALTKDTHWVTEEEETSKPLCQLEEFALNILRHHQGELEKKKCPYLNDGYSIGAEWWVQVKPISSVISSAGLECPTANEAIDLHYDKDEAIATHFELGRFPLLSTVSYLSRHPSAPPTMIFDHTYETPQSEIQDVLVSYPVPGKHLVFDGRLLHGAPSHFSLRRTNASGEGDLTRVTFLVNIWVNHHPAQVKPLGDTLRQTMIERETLQLGLIKLDGPASIVTCDILSVSGLEETGRIQLPFVGGNATWAEDEEEASTIVTMLPPPCSESSEGCTVLYHFGPGLEATIENQEDEEVSIGSISAT